VRFLTLTTARPGDDRHLSEHFEALVKRIRRRYGRFEYCKVRTDEGYGVLHLLYRGGYIPQKWVSDAWREIHGAGVVDVRAVGKGVRKAARYLAGHLALQGGHLSWSWGWVWHGFVRDWERLKKAWHNAARGYLGRGWTQKTALPWGSLLAVWRWHLAMNSPP